ncbi:unnamed protein product, partial [Pelagomonas calceolata]
LLTPKSKRVATNAMPKFKARAEAAEHDTDNWEVGARHGQACYFSPGGRLYMHVPAALTRMDEGPKLPTRAEQIKAAGGIKARLALCLSRATLLAPDEASAIQLLRDRFAAYPEVRSFLAAYDEPHRTVGDKVAALLTPTRHHVISRAQHARVKGGSRVGGLTALGFGVLKARTQGQNSSGTNFVKDDDGNQVYTFSITSENTGTDKSHKKNGAYATPQAARPGAAAAYDVVARREALPVNTPTSVLEACRSVVAATLFYGTGLYHYVRKYSGKYQGCIKVRGIDVVTPTVASAELAAALVTTGLEALDRRVPQARRCRGPREARVQGPEPGPLGPRRARPHHQGPVQGPLRVRGRGDL